MKRFDSSQDILEFLQEFAPDAQLVTGYNDCLIGVAEKFGGVIAVYDRDKIIEALMEEMNEDDAEEWFSVNMNGSYVGKQTPMYLAGLHKDV